MAGAFSSSTTGACGGGSGSSGPGETVAASGSAGTPAEGKGGVTAAGAEASKGDGPSSGTGAVMLIRQLGHGPFTPANFAGTVSRMLQCGQ
ncbi:hypothetical protein OJ996_21430 [Luteolibacter sp. GHJ8]|uniref:Uncharacterized protein n=1 Tax=Luteolibacter rhizosphaerae TaxID=2989719 RepID=A0ABT3G8I7_9BACT|nr:hypothetical protein [Luteolibacter rhizosphaerae]MCW1916166.1 hypothetical protein [Luteolibacter rhizosphaerae]